MDWSPEQVLHDFRTVAKLAGISLPGDAIEIETLAAPHKPPSRLPPGKMAVYVFSMDGACLKVGKAGPKSQARYISQHYNPRSAQSTLAASLLAASSDGEGERFGLTETDEDRIGEWIREHVDRVNFLLDESCGVPVLTLLESFLQCRLKPAFEGFKSQRA